jgi:MFS transporter, FSR family, fosmidomycin resistance protein
MSIAEASLGRDVRVIGLVGVAHGLSHFFQMVLPPIFVLLKTEFDVSFTALGLLITLMYLASGFSQLLFGFLVDRVGARRILLLGLIICSLGTLGLATAQDFWILVSLAIVIGVGLGVFHPADLSILTHKINPQRLGRAYAIHALCGNLGWAVAPPFIVGLAALYDWRTAVAAAGASGLVFVAVMLTRSGDLADEILPVAEDEPEEQETLGADIRLLLSAPIFLCFCYFTFYAMAVIGVQSFGALSLMKLHDMAFADATTALTAFLVSSAVGVLVGGVIADRTTRHHVLAMVGATLASLFMFGVATISGSVMMVPLLMIMAGFFLGLTMPSRDMIVRKVTPPKKAGRVFGFVYAGLDLGSLSMPVLLGYLLDRGDPKIVILLVAFVLLVTVPTVMRVSQRTSHAARQAAE